MSAIITLSDLVTAGIHVTTDGARLRVEAQPGSITPELRHRLAESKIKIITQLSAELRHRLEAIANAQGLAAELIRNLPQIDIDECFSLSDPVLMAYVRALADSQLRAQGQRPPDETTKAICQYCGPIWLAPEVAALATIVDGLPFVLGCPWCHNRPSRYKP